MTAQEYKDFPTTSTVISATIKTECIEHYNATPLDVLLEEYRLYISQLESRCALLSFDLETAGQQISELNLDLEIAEQKLEEVYYRRGVSY